MYTCVGFHFEHRQLYTFIRFLSLCEPRNILSYLLTLVYENKNILFMLAEKKIHDILTGKYMSIL